MPTTKMTADNALDLSDEIVHRVRRQLLMWGRANFQHFAWRSEQNPWLTLVAELMLQRTRATQVEPIYLDFAARYPRAEDLVLEGPDAAETVTQRLGIHWRGPLL